MKYHSLFFSNIRRDVTKFVSAIVVIGAFRVQLEPSVITSLNLVQLYLEIEVELMPFENLCKLLLLVQNTYLLAFTLLLFQSLISILQQ